VGKIAASGDPGALDLFRNVLTASASIPGVFSPVLIDVEADGRRRRFAEMHVDGGVTTNVLILPEAILMSGTPVFPPDAWPKVYVVMNSQLAPDFEVVKASFPRAARQPCLIGAKSRTLSSWRREIEQSLTPLLDLLTCLRTPLTLGLHENEHESAVHTIFEDGCCPFAGKARSIGDR
jgi:hypothetical protein